MMNKRFLVMVGTIFFVGCFSVWSGKELFAVSHRDSQKNVDDNRALPQYKIEEEGQKQEAGTDEHIDGFDLQQKQNDVRSLLERGIEFCANNNHMANVCHAFTHTKDFIEGELYLFLLDPKGVVYAHGEQEDLLWRNLWDYRDSFGAFAVQSIIKTAQAGPGWLTYEWSGAVKVSYVQKIMIEGKEYVIGCGYYPHSKKYAAIGLVKGAVALFNQDVAQGHPIERAFGTMGYSLSERFMYGDLYLYALDFNGIIRAQGDDPGLIGSPALERKDAQGKMINKEIIDKLKAKEEGDGVWIQYTSKNALKVTYAEKVKDAQGNYYFIASGYYPEIDRDKTVDLVRRAYQFMKASGTSVAAKQFTEKNIYTYRLGDLFIFVYDMQGNCIAHGGNDSFVGQNHFDLKDEDGRYYVREIVHQARAGGGWLDFKLKNSFQATYVEKIDMGVDTYIIGAGMFPVSKPETMTLLVKSAIGYFNSHPVDEVFKSLVDRKGAFIRGDLFVFALDTDGYCYAWGDTYELIWKNLIEWKDDEGKTFIKEMIDLALQGPDLFVYKFNKRMRVDYVEIVEKDDKTYLLGSGFYK
jgi:signal transduction histidine kinase